MKKSVAVLVLCLLGGVWLFLSFLLPAWSEKTATSSIENNDDFDLDKFLWFEYQWFLDPYPQYWSLSEEFTQRRIPDYLKNRKHLKELVYHCRNAAASASLKKECKSIRRLLDEDQYDYTSIIASTGEIQELIATIKKGENIEIIQTSPDFLLPLENLDENLPKEIHYSFQIGERYLIIPYNQKQLFLAKKGDTQAKLLLSIEDNPFFKHNDYGCENSMENRIYFLAIKNRQLHMSIVDRCGGGSGDGYENVFVLNDQGRLEHLACYDYSNRHIFQDKGKDWYFGGTMQFEKLIPVEKTICKGREQINYYLPPIE